MTTGAVSITNCTACSPPSGKSHAAAIPFAAIPGSFDKELAAAVPTADAMETESWATLHPPPSIRDASCIEALPI
ncbi:MAG: hypothetical protein LBT46_07075 [Planctomycetaceae bacterium]|nr:hypothetical protein [Planctomycetaceae bacterium]